MTTEEPSANSIVESLLDLGDRLLRAGLPSVSECPRTLYHFTDASGVIGIIENHALRASRARCMNDAGEVRYALALARTYLEDRLRDARDQPFRRAFRERALHFLNPENVDPRVRVLFDPFVVSLCPSADEGSHWLNYGRGGNGYALGFHGDQIKMPAVDPVRVIYDREEQMRMIASIVEELEEKFLSLAHGREANIQARTREAAAHVLADTIWAKAAWMKDPAFATEREWRLISMDIQGSKIPKDIGTPVSMEFRSQENRIVPYLVIDYARFGSGKLPLASITVGSRVDLQIATQSLRHLLRKKEYDESLPIVSSGVPLQ